MKPEIQKQKSEQHRDKLVDQIGLTERVVGSFKGMELHPLLIRGANGDGSNLLFLTASGEIDPSNFKKIKDLTIKQVPGVELICVDYGSGEGRGSIIFSI